MDNKRLKLDAAVSDRDAVNTEGNDPQTINAVTPVNIDQDVALDLDTLIDGIAVDTIESLSIDGDVLFLPVTVCIIDNRVSSVSLDMRLACNRDRYTMLDVKVTDQFDMVSNIRTADEYFTVVDLFGNEQPGSYHLLREGGGGFVTYENGNRILII